MFWYSSQPKAHLHHPLSPLSLVAPCVHTTNNVQKVSRALKSPPSTFQRSDSHWESGSQLKVGKFLLVLLLTGTQEGRKSKSCQFLSGRFLDCCLTLSVSPSFSSRDWLRDQHFLDFTDTSSSFPVWTVPSFLLMSWNKQGLLNERKVQLFHFSHLDGGLNQLLIQSTSCALLPGSAQKLVLKLYSCFSLINLWNAAVQHRQKGNAET